MNKEVSLGTKIHDQPMEESFHFGNESCKQKTPLDKSSLHAEKLFEVRNYEVNFQPILTTVQMLNNTLP